MSRGAKIIGLSLLKGLLDRIQPSLNLSNLTSLLFIILSLLKLRSDTVLIDARRDRSLRTTLRLLRRYPTQIRAYRPTRTNEPTKVAARAHAFCCARQSLTEHANPTTITAATRVFIFSLLPGRRNGMFEYWLSDTSAALVRVRFLDALNSTATQSAYLLRNRTGKWNWPRGATTNGKVRYGDSDP